MSFNPYARNRMSIRLKECDYSQSGAYFITICTHHHKCFFGEITAEGMQLNAWGKLASKSWENIPSHFPFVILDSFIIMPNHVHGIINISQSECRGIACYAPTERKSNRFGQVVAGSVSAIVRSYKSAVTRRVNQEGFNSNGSVWQRGYYEHIVRNEDELTSIREYIQYNPLKWLEDIDNPANTPLLILPIRRKI